MKKNLILYGLVIIYIILNAVWLNNITLYNEVINPLIWIGMAFAAWYMSKDENFRIKDLRNKTQSLVIVMIIYLIIYYLLGLIFGFQNTPYSKELLSILRNIWSFGGIIVFQEIVRHAMIRLEPKKVMNYVIITILFVVVNISFSNFTDNFNTLQDSFTYIVSTFIPLCVASGVLTYLSYVGGTRLPIIYRLSVVLPEFIIPIVPSLNWFVTAIIGLVLPIVIFIYLNYVHVKKEQRLSRKDRRRNNPILYLPIFVFIALLAGFVIGLFKYQPIAVLSGSMSPTFNRGDAVIVRKLTTTEKDQLEVGDIIEYTSGSKYVVHRIIEIDTDVYGNRVFITQGDANNAADSDDITYDQVVGKVSCIIPYVGYPSVWLSGMLE